MMEDDETDLREQIFHNTVREQIISLLVLGVLYMWAHALIERYRRRASDDLVEGDEEELLVYRLSLWLCTFSLAVALGSALLLPLSILGNEILALYPNSYYVQWLNTSLIQGMWNHMFVLCNVSVFVALPFAWLVSEAAGFAGSGRGVGGRLREASTVLALLVLAALGLAHVLHNLLPAPTSALDLWSYLPFIYSCVSFLGAVMLLLLTPLGFVQLVGAGGRALAGQNAAAGAAGGAPGEAGAGPVGGTPREPGGGAQARLARDTTRRRLRHALLTGGRYTSPAPLASGPGYESGALLDSTAAPGGLALPGSGVNGAARWREWSARAMGAVSLVLGGCALFAVALHALQLAWGRGAVQAGGGGGAGAGAGSVGARLGLASSSRLGWVGALLEVALIVYLEVAALAGLGGVGAGAGPGCWWRRRATPLPRLVAGTALLGVQGCGAPLVARALGLTAFDLLGEMARVPWLASRPLLLACNLLFAGTLAAALARVAARLKLRPAYLP